MSSRRRRIRRQRPVTSSIWFRLTAILVGVMLVLGITGVATASAFVNSWLQDLPDYRDPNAFKVAEATRIWSADGKLLAKLYLQNRTVVPLSKMSTDLPNGVIAIEDERFFEHQGVDPKGIIRALVSTAQGTREGASTITQQYIRNTILISERLDMTPARKVREAYLAMQLEKRFSKQQILEMYLNTVYFGEGAYGAEAASHTFFSKSAQNLSLPEAALLAGVLQRPSGLDPFENPKGAVERRNQVLARMLANGYISQAEYKQAVKTKLKLKRGAEPDQGIYDAPYFVAHVRKMLLQKYPQAVVFKGGLNVYTTLDTEMQHEAEKVVARNLNEKGDPVAALVCIDPHTGYVKAMYGGADYKKSPFNLATQGRRQPGSSFKTFALAAAMADGVPPWQNLDSSSPAEIPAKPKPWVVSNSEGDGNGLMSLESATWHSVNTAYARLTQGIGVKRVVRMAKKMGISTPLPDYPSVTLGTRNVSPLEMASAYGTLAANGTHYTPFTITKIVNADGETIFRQKPHGERALRADVAKAVTDVLEGVITQGTATRADIGRPAAGKTGTSQNYRDAWFVGYTPQLVTSVWVGYPTEKPMLDVHGDRGFGGYLAAPIWADFMSAVLSGKPTLDFRSAPEPKWTADRFTFPVSDKGLAQESAKKAAVAAAKKAATKKTIDTGTTGGGGGNTGGGSTGGGIEPPPPPPPPDTGGGGGTTTTTP